jgi:hypothetical protein
MRAVGVEAPDLSAAILNRASTFDPKFLHAFMHEDTQYRFVSYGGDAQFDGTRRRRARARELQLSSSGNVEDLRNG